MAVLVPTTLLAQQHYRNFRDRFGLAQLYQLRGRVGRSHHRAYAHLITPTGKRMTPDAEKRLDAISALEELGMGFTLATHDFKLVQTHPRHYRPDPDNNLRITKDLPDLDARVRELERLLGDLGGGEAAMFFCGSSGLRYWLMAVQNGNLW